MVGGGTSGHISPTLACADSLLSKGSDISILYVGQNSGPEADIVRRNNLPFIGIQAGKWRRYQSIAWYRLFFRAKNLFLNIKDIFAVFRGIIQSIRLIMSWKPDAIFIKGGYVGLPVGLAALLLRRPYIIHESDIVMGWTNRILAPGAKKVAVGFPKEFYPHIATEKLVFTGNPIRSGLTGYHRLEGVQMLKLKAELPILLVVGGSQGARFINQLILESLPRLLDKTQVVHICGQKDEKQIANSVSKLGLGENIKRYRSFGFLHEELGPILAAADIVISRPGASAIAELAALSKPVILIPNEHLAGGHQLANALALSRKGAARILRESKLTPDQLIAEVNKILSSEDEQQKLATDIKAFAAPEAAEILAKQILLLGGAK